MVELRSSQVILMVQENASDVTERLRKYEVVLCGAEIVNGLLSCASTLDLAFAFCSCVRLSLRSAWQLSVAMCPVTLLA